MTTLTLRPQILRAIHAGLTSKAVEADAATLTIYESHILVRQVNANKSGMYFLMSEPVEWDGENSEFTLSKDDLRTIANLSDDPISLSIEEGKITCKVGKIKKILPLQTQSKFTEMNPRPDMEAKFSVTDEIMKSLKSAFSDVTNGSVCVHATPEKVFFSIKDSSTVRSTEMELTKEECKDWDIKGEVYSSFDRDLFGAMVDGKIKGSEASIEFGSNKPLFLMQSTDDFRSKILLAPVIED